MGTRPPASNEAAPAYDDLFDGHARPPNAVSGYAPIAQAEQNDDIEHTPHSHHHIPSFPLVNPINPPANLAVDNLSPPEHIHCEACDRLLERKQRRNNERHCCTMVALTFIIAFLCLMILGIVVAKGGRKW